MHTHSHSHSHSHDHGHHHTMKDTKALKIAIAMTLVIFTAQIIGSVLSGSIALLSDAGHMLTDAGALIIAFVALKLYTSGKNNPSRLQQFTFGFKRIEVLAAMINGIILFSMCGYLIYESVMRFFHVEDVHTEPMLITSVIGLIANIISAIMLHNSHHLSTRSAYLHVITDLLSSVAVIIGGIAIYYTGWNIIDTILSIAISIFIFRSAYRLIKTAGTILMDSAPAGLTVQNIENTLQSIAHIDNIHDVHIWEMSPGNIAVSAHITTSYHNHNELLEMARHALVATYSTHHITLQIEDAAFSKEHGCDQCSSHEGA